MQCGIKNIKPKGQSENELQNADISCYQLRYKLLYVGLIVTKKQKKYIINTRKLKRKVSIPLKKVLTPQRKRKRRRHREELQPKPRNN